MFQALAEAIEELDIPPVGDAIAEVICLRDRLGAAICEAVGAFDASGGWEIEGATSMTAWLRQQGRQAGGDAARLSSTARRSDILDYGRTTRTIPPALWAAVVLRDRHCRFPGCDRGPGWCEGHHVRFWGHDGPTALENIALACTRHHHLLHRPGWEAKLLPSGDFHVTTPEGRVLVGELPP